MVAISKDHFSVVDQLAGGVVHGREGKLAEGLPVLITLLWIKITVEVRLNFYNSTSDRNT